MICLVGCAARKLRAIAPARQLYVSQLFRMAAAYAELNADRWFILSAKYGLVDPDQEVEPYEKTMQKMCPVERHWWGQSVSVKLAQMGLHKQPIEIHAGVYYSVPLKSWLKHADIPLHGLAIGRRLAWYKERLPSNWRKLVRA